MLARFGGGAAREVTLDQLRRMGPALESVQVQTTDRSGVARWVPGTRFATTTIAVSDDLIAHLGLRPTE